MAPVPGKVREQHHARISVYILRKRCRSVQMYTCVRVPTLPPSHVCPRPPAPCSILHVATLQLHMCRDLISAEGAVVPTPAPVSAYCMLIGTCCQATGMEAGVTGVTGAHYQGAVQVQWVAVPA